MSQQWRPRKLPPRWSLRATLRRYPESKGSIRSAVTRTTRHVTAETGMNHHPFVKNRQGHSPKKLCASLPSMDIRPLRYTHRQRKRNRPAPPVPSPEPPIWVKLPQSSHPAPFGSRGTPSDSVPLRSASSIPRTCPSPRTQNNPPPFRRGDPRSSTTEKKRNSFVPGSSALPRSWQ